MVGLGIMGKPMASNLLRAGFEVIAYNRSANRLNASGEAAAVRRRARARLPPEPTSW